MTDTTISLTPAAAGVSGAQTITASAALFTAADVGRMLAIYHTASVRAASTYYDVGKVFYSEYNGTPRLYRVIGAGTTAAANMAGTTPNYDLNAPRETGLSIFDNTVRLRYLGQGKTVWGWARITGYTDSTHVVVDVDPHGPFAQATASVRWRLGEWSDARGWPRAMTYFGGRAYWCGSLSKPQTIWASATGDYKTMSPCEPDGTVLDTSAITETLDDDQLNTVRWVLAFAEGLAIGAESGEFVAGPANANGAISPSNFRARRKADRGSSADVPALRISGVVLFLQGGGRQLRQLEYDFGTDSFTTLDLTQLSDHITGPGVVEMAYQARPAGTLWLVRSDGKLVTLTFDREQKVRAWALHELGGTDARVESVACVPNPEGTEDDVYVAVARTINGAAVRTIEYIRRPYRADLDGDAGGFFVDAGLTYAGPPALTFSGLNHLERELVWICADGSVRENRTVFDGTVTITGNAASLVHIGLPYTSRVTTLPVEAGAAGGTAQNKPKRIHQIGIRLLETRGGRVGRDGEGWEALTQRMVDDPIGQAPPLFTGDRTVPFPAGWDRQGQITIEHADPLPCTVLAVLPELQTNA